MLPFDDEAQQRLADLTKRQRHLMIGCGLSAAVFMLSITALFMQQSWIYAFFDLSIQVQHLDLPYSLQDLVPYTQPVDYFFNLLSWVGWLLLKTVLAFFGAFILLRWAKKIGFFQSRFQAWTQRFVAWLIAFIVLWSGLSYVQYARKNDTTQAQKQWISYSHHINESDIAQDYCTQIFHRPSELMSWRKWHCYSNRQTVELQIFL